MGPMGSGLQIPLSSVSTPITTSTRLVGSGSMHGNPLVPLPVVPSLMGKPPPKVFAEVPRHQADPALEKKESKALKKENHETIKNGAVTGLVNFLSSS